MTTMSSAPGSLIVFNNVNTEVLGGYLLFISGDIHSILYPKWLKPTVNIYEVHAIWSSVFIHLVPLLLLLSAPVLWLWSWHSSCHVRITFLARILQLSVFPSVILYGQQPTSWLPLFWILVHFRLCQRIYIASKAKPTWLYRRMGLLITEIRKQLGI